MRGSPTLIDRILGQAESDDPNTRSIAFEKAREILLAEGVTLRDLHNAYRREKERAEATTRQAAPPPPPPAPPPPPPPPSRPAPAARAADPPGRDDRSGRTKDDARGPDFAGAQDRSRVDYVHPPRVGMFTRKVNGKRIVRNTVPPKGSVGVLRILKDEGYMGNSGPRRRLTMSFETDDTVYEPFEDTGSKTVWIEQMRRLSATLNPVIW